MPRILVIGLGHDLRGDDGAGLRVVRRLEGRVPETVRLIEAPPDAVALLDLWEGADRVVLIDAMRSGAPAGTVAAVDAGSESDAGRLVGESTVSSHAMGLAEAVALARVLDRLPRRLRIYGIEAASLVHGAPLSEAVLRAADALADRLVAELWASALVEDAGG
jgi:hydrogenase maturation protease